jgi:hypothetical protein
VSLLQLSASGWSFSAQNDSLYGTYWAATPIGESVSIAAGAAITISVANLKATTSTGQAKLYFDYYAVDGAADGVFVENIVVERSS